MSTYAHIVNGVVAEPLFTPPAGFSIGECFASGLQWVDVTNVSPQPGPGWSATQSNGKWTFSAPPESPALSAAGESAILAVQARNALDDSDRTVLRCYEHALPVPVAWAVYRAALRAIVSTPASATSLPTKPAYPAGT